MASLLGLGVFLFITRVGNSATVVSSEGFHGLSTGLLAPTRSGNSLLSEVLWLTAPRSVDGLLERVSLHQTATEHGVSVAGAPGTALVLGSDSHNGDGSKG